jgi:ABC-2 type transport system ATP-binding protein
MIEAKRTPIIDVQHIRKLFRTPVTREGRFAGIRTLFSREYREMEAVKDISFSIERGEFVGYIGPNGAGKSTTIKMLTGILHPTSGEVRINGVSPHRDRRQVVKRLGVVFGQRSQMWWDLPVKDSYDILAEMYGVDAKDKRTRLGQLSELLGLAEFWLTPVRKLSLGQRMRADLAAAMLHDPELLFLDEPTIGLDVTAKRNIRAFLKTLNRDFGKTVLLTTHDMDDIEQLCERVMVINRGELAYDGSIGQLRERIGLPTVIRVTYRGKFMVAKGFGIGMTGESVVKDSANGLTSSRLAAARITEVTDDSITVAINRQDIKAMDILRELGTFGDIDDIVMEEPAFEDVIHRIY